jgi:hypothetical protein
MTGMKIGQWLLLAVIFWCFAEMAQAAPENLRVYVLSGQGGFVMSRGMEELAAGLRKMDPRLQVSTHEWKNHQDVAKDIGKLPVETPVVLIGHSLGANATTWISHDVSSRMIDLIVAYDPTKLAKLQPAGKNVRRVLLYHNNSAEPWGHARIQGPQVETVETKNSHLSIGSSSWLRGKTQAAVARVISERLP